MANISLTLYTNGFFGSVLKSPTQMGSLSINNSVSNISRLDTFKGTVSWDRFQKFWQKFTEPGLTKGRSWFLNFFRGSNDFIIQKVHLLRLMPVCVGLILFSCLFLSAPPITSGVSLNMAECKAACRLHLLILNRRNIGSSKKSWRRFCMILY